MKLFKGLFIVAIVLVIVFIWSNSLKSIPESLEQSNNFKGFIESILTNNGRNPITEFDQWILDNLRKIAHFVEFFVLAMLGGAYAMLLSDDKKAKYLCLIGIVLIAAVDEIIQIFSSRGPSVVDVLIDCLGGAAGFGIMIVAAIAVEYIVEQKKLRRKAE